MGPRRVANEHRSDAGSQNMTWGRRTVLAAIASALGASRLRAAADASETRLVLLGTAGGARLPKTIIGSRTLRACNGNFGWKADT